MLGAHCEDADDGAPSHGGDAVDRAGASGARASAGANASSLVDCAVGVTFVINVSAPAPSSTQRSATLSMQIGGPLAKNRGPTMVAPWAFSVEAGSLVLPLRVMADVATLELFVAGGRAVASTSVYSTGTRLTVAAAASDGAEGVVIDVVQGWTIATTSADSDWRPAASSY